MELIGSPREIRILSVVRNSLTGERGVVMRVSGDHLELRGKTGEVSRYKFGKHFQPVLGDEAVEFRAVARAAVKSQTPEKPRRRRSVTAFLARLGKSA